MVRIIVVCVLLIFSWNCVVAAEEVTVDWNDTHQVIDGFGASTAWRSGITDSQADMFFSVDKGIGLSLLRNRIAPTIPATTSELSIMQKAQARGARVWSAPWSPPAAWKTNNDVNNGGHLLASRYQDYANQQAAYVDSMKSAGVNIYAISVQNEPNYAATWESCEMSAQELHDFIPFLYNALAAKGLDSTKILMPEDSHWRFDLDSTTMNDPTTANMVDILAAHNYDFGTPAVVNTHGKHLWETEVSDVYGVFDSSMTDAIVWVRRIHNFLTLAEVNAWHYWWLFCPGSYCSNNQALTGPYFSPTKRMYILGNYSKFVRPGFRRIGVTSTGSLLVSAYKDPAGETVAIVAVNPSRAGAITANFTLSGFGLNSVTPWITSNSLSLAQQADISVSGSSFSYILPANTVATLVGQALTHIRGMDIKRDNNIEISVHPNPFNPKTVIEVSSPVSGVPVVAGVYDLQGKMVKTFTPCYITQNSGGVMRYTWDAGSRQSGIFIVKVKINKTIQTKRITLLK